MKAFDPRNLLALVVGCILALGLGEVACRVLDIGAPRRAVAVEDRTTGEDGPWPYRPGSVLTYRYPGNPRGYFSADNTVTGHINSFGFRGRETTLLPDSGTIRIAFLGDSFTLGVGVRDEHTLPFQTETGLHTTDPTVEVLNFGVSNTATAYQMQLLRDYVLEFRPRVVIVVVFLNDSGSLPTIAFLSRPWYFRRIRKYSWLANAVTGALERSSVTRRMVEVYEASFADSSDGYRILKTELTEGARLAQSHGVRFVVAVYPVLFHVGEDYPFSDIHRRIGDFCASRGIPFIDLQPAFEGRRDWNLWVHATDQHPNETAHALAAEFLAGRLRSMNVLEALPEPRPGS